ncbi:MAG TPA: hypothetical protein PLO63_00460 [Syntrophales bacterium]|nr:hypothetical protein [Syntrophales bacterium]
MNTLRIRAGRSAMALIRDGGFSLDAVRSYYGPASGPRWLIVSGFDRTLLSSGVLGNRHPVLLAGSSAGAWRFAAWLQPEPEKSYNALIESYLTASYHRKDSPQDILKTLGGIINTFLERDAVPFALANKKYRFAVSTMRCRPLTASERPWIQKGGFMLSYLMNIASPSTLHTFGERVIFYNGPKPPSFCLRSDFRGTFIRLSATNFRAAVLASGAIPVVVAGVRDIFGAPTGIYRDGGFFDYHLTHRYTERDDEVTLFFNHQERIIPGWMDKKRMKRRPSEEILDNVLMVYPSEAFVEGLPGGKVPDRDDLTDLIDDPETRIRNWWQTVRQSAHFGEEFLELVESGRIRDVVEPIS